MKAKTGIQELKEYRKECEVVAKDFEYPQVVFDSIKKAQSVNELSRVMHNAMKYIV